MRKQMTLPEVLLWQLLKSRPTGLKFRKQHPIGDLVADFYCDATKTVIEVDGLAHDLGTQPESDLKRDTAFRARGYRVVRIPAVEVFRDPTAMVEAILAACHSAPPPSALRAATSPGGGGS
ncbi:endonuclease domain-containing protein [Altererythrobacter fulvus]|uniref:endonuclease domain-containing protein n=1 Tax=Caenibius fulvus TaxID=2126012 RepID=UPI00301A57D1